MSNTGRCRQCSKKHHNSLHKDTDTNPMEAEGATETTSHAESVNSIEPTPKLEASLQMTNQVIVESPEGKQLQARALLDPGASVLLVTQHIVQQLQLPKYTQNLDITGAQGTSTGNSHYAVTLLVKPTSAGSSPLCLTAALVPRVTCDLPLERAPGVRTLNYIKNLKLADPNFDQPW